MTSNRTLRNVVEDVLNQVYTGRRAKDRPDLILAGLHERRVLVELKRPDHTISRGDITQAQRYRDQLARYLPMMEIPIIVIGEGLIPSFVKRIIATSASDHFSRLSIKRGEGLTG